MTELKIGHETTGDVRECINGDHAQCFVPKRNTNFQQHQRRIERLLSEGMHDGKKWKSEAFARYNELEDQEVLPVTDDETRNADVRVTNGAIAWRSNE